MFRPICNFISLFPIRTNLVTFKGAIIKKRINRTKSNDKLIWSKKGPWHFDSKNLLSVFRMLNLCTS